MKGFDCLACSYLVSAEHMRSLHIKIVCILQSRPYLRANYVVVDLWSAAYNASSTKHQ